jgi:ribosomal protein S12 methylthiotransferase accessory factor
LAYYHLPRGNQRFVFEISNGCAVGNRIDEAILHGLLEVIERDAYLATWYGQIPARQIDLDASDDRYVAALRAKLEGDGFEVIACDIGVGFSSPAVAAFAVDRRPGAATSLVCAAGAHLDPNKAIAGALVEVCTMLVKRTAQEDAALHERGLTLLSEPALVRTSNDHIDQCRPAQALQRMDFMLGSRPRQGGGPQWVLRSTPDSPVNLSIRLQALVEEVLAVAQDILVVDQTFPDLERHALRCVKVLAPGLLPMTFGHQYRRISVPRLEQARKSCGLAIRVPGGDRWLPHTFP